MARILTVANQKGGVGKTTTVMNLGVALHRKGQRVLLVDSDPQANLSSHLGVVPGGPGYEALSTLDELYLSKKPPEGKNLDPFIAKTASGPDLIASDSHLTGVEHYLFQRPEREMVLARLLSKVAHRYDVILIDTPPSTGLLTLNALSASDSVLIPVQPEFFSLEGIVKIRSVIEEVRARHNPKLSILGVLATQVSARRKLTEEVLTALRAELGNLLFETVIHDGAAVSESSGHGQSVIEYDRSSKGALDYLAACEELLLRLQNTPTHHLHPLSQETQL